MSYQQEYTFDGLSWVVAHVAVVLPQISKYAKFSVCTKASKSAHLLGRPSPPGRSTSTGLEGVTKE